MKTIEDEINEARADELAEKEVMENQKEEARFFNNSCNSCNSCNSWGEYDAQSVIAIPLNMLLELERVSQNYKALLNFLGNNAFYAKPQGYQLRSDMCYDFFKFLAAIDEEVCTQLQLKADYKTENFSKV